MYREQKIPAKVFFGLTLRSATAYRCSAGVMVGHNGALLLRSVRESLVFAVTGHCPPWMFRKRNGGKTRRARMYYIPFLKDSRQKNFYHWSKHLDSELHKDWLTRFGCTYVTFTGSLPMKTGKVKGDSVHFRPTVSDWCYFFFPHTFLKIRVGYTKNKMSFKLASVYREEIKKDSF